MRCHYVMWKRSHHSSIIGFQHYRRLFNFKDKTGLVDLTTFQCYRDYWLKDDWAKQHTQFQLDRLADDEIIVPRKQALGATLGDQYAQAHSHIDWTEFKRIVEYYMGSGIDFNVTNIYPGNMFITKKTIFHRYMEFWWTVMQDVEKQILVDLDCGYQSRTFGFLSERLFTLWLQKAGLRIIELPVLFCPELTA